MSDNAPSTHCTRCDNPLPQDAPGGICPRCLLALSLETNTLDDPATDPQPAPSVESLAPHFPQLEILQCLARGGMGVVYKARQKSLNREVALKLLAPERADDSNFADRFQKEAQALASLNHPHIVTIHDFGESGGHFFFLMEFVDGVNLRQAMDTGQFTPQQALALVPPICEALQFAHDQGIVHRDIKPENLLLDKVGRLKIADFGIARILTTNSDPNNPELPNSSGQTLAGGTPRYMAPEQKDNPNQVDHRADIYATGLVLYELLTGEIPAGKLQPLSQKVGLDIRIDEVVLKALQEEPEHRYASAADFQTHIEGVQTPPAQTATQPKKSNSTRTILTILAVLVTLFIGLLILISALLFLSRVKKTAAFEQTKDEVRAEGISLQQHLKSPKSNDMNLKEITKKAGTAAIAATITTSATAEELKPVDDNARAELKQESNKRFREDRNEYNRQELAELEELYQVANKNWKTDKAKAKEAMEQLVKSYKKANRTGCAILYLGQLSRGDERDQYLDQAIEDFSDCYYGNGVQVGGWARYLRILDLRSDGKDQEADKLEKELRTKYKGAISHSGYLLTDLLDQANASN